MVLFLTVGVIFIIIGAIGWNSEERKTRREELRQAQLEALKKGHKEVQIKGKMRKLK